MFRLNFKNPDIDRQRRNTFLKLIVILFLLGANLFFINRLLDGAIFGDSLFAVIVVLALITAGVISLKN